MSRLSCERFAAWQYRYVPPDDLIEQRREWGSWTGDPVGIAGQFRYG
jgi:hypothetical protein